MMDSRNVFGAEIQYFRLDPKYWDRVLRQFKDAGLRCATTYVQWATHLVGDPDTQHPAGYFDFAGKTDPRLNLLHFLDLVHKHGLLLNFRCGPFCCNEMIHGGYPAWLVMGDPSLMVWDYQNRTTQGYWIGKKEGSQPSYLHPEYLRLCSHWLGEVDAIIKPRLQSAGGFITMINLDNEVSYIVKDSLLDSDYNPVNVRPGGFYSQFLKEKYGSVERLADAHGQSYSSFDDAAPPRSVPASISREFARYGDWVEFKTWVMCRYISAVRQMHEANGVVDVTFMTNFNPHRPEGVPTRMPDFERAVTGKAGKGIVGYDFYRGAFLSYSGYSSIARVLKLMNASLKYTWSAEFMAGLWNKDMTKTSRISDDHMRFMARCALAHGCKSIAWFMFHDRDCWGDAPVSEHGHARPSLDVLRETPRLLFEKLRSWDRLVPLADCAVIYDLIQHVHTSIGDPAPCADNELHVGPPIVGDENAGVASREYEGLYRLVEQAGYQAAAVDAIHDLGRLNGYKLAFLPGSPLAERNVSEGLRAWVEKGGTLVVSGAWPTLDEHGKPLAFLNLAERSLGSVKIGQGMVYHTPTLAQADPEHETTESVERVSQLLRNHAGPAVVQVATSGEISWRDWQPGGGHKLYTQPRNLASAILHQSAEERVLFVLNHYLVAAELRLIFGPTAGKVSALVDLDTDERIAVDPATRIAMVDLDRKSARVYRVE